MADIVDLTGTEYVSNIPAVYYKCNRKYSYEKTRQSNEEAWITDGFLHVHTRNKHHQRR